MTTDRKEASFLVGGQFPVPVVQGGATAGAVTVQFKEYGIKLNFLPAITSNNTIKMHLRQEVSTLDLTNAVVLNGFTIPALAARTAESDVELGDGQSFVVAGLINNQETNALSKVPVLGNLPILGALFKSKDDNVQRLELIMVTPVILARYLYAQGLPEEAGSQGSAGEKRQEEDQHAVSADSTRAGIQGRREPSHMSARSQNEAEITALLIAPHREMAQQFLATLPQTKAFQILADLKSYPPLQTLEIRARQLQPHVVLLDLATELSTAVELIRFMSPLTPAVHVVGLHTQNDSQAILQSLRAGASEFLYAPFELATQREAIARLRRLVSPEMPAEPQEGHTVRFFERQTRFRRFHARDPDRVLARAAARQTGLFWIDYDLTGGTIGFYLKLSHNDS